MIKIILFIAFGLMLTGCATYKFEKGAAPYDKGYVVTRDTSAIPEFTLGQNNTVPDDLHLAKERFQRRRNSVENYYLQLGLIDTRFNEYFWGPASALTKFIISIIITPVRFYNDYKYHHNPKYKELVDHREVLTLSMDEARINKTKTELSAFIKNDLARENNAPTAK